MSSGPVDLETLRMLLDVQQVQLRKLNEEVAALRRGTQTELDLADPPDWCWRNVDERAAGRMWRELTDWLGWLHARYPLAETIRPCWWRHPEVVEEVTAAYVAWRGAFTEPGAPSYAAAEWHERWLPGLERRLADRWRTGRCETGHVERNPGAYGDPVDDLAAYAGHVAADARRRRGEPDVTDGTDGRICAADMLAHLASGRAHSLGGLPGSPIRYRDGLWRPAGQHFEPISDPDVIARLAADDERLAAADAAVDATTTDGGGDDSP